MTDVRVVQGVPGGGKTHELRERVESALRDEKDVTYRNFTNSGTVETANDLKEDLPFRVVEPHLRDGEGHGDFCDRITGTLHGLSFRLALENAFIDDMHQVIQPTDAPAWTTDDLPDGFTGHPSNAPVEANAVPTGENLYVKFCRQHGLNYAVDPNTPMRAVLRGDNIDQHEYSTDGNAVFAAFEWAKMNYGPTANRARKARQSPVDLPVPGSRVEDLYEKWEAFKNDRDRVEHSDYIDAVIQHGWTPDVDVLCVDEFQDLAPLEHKLLWTWIEQDAVDELHLAGDVNQSIYSFRGARPGFMQEMRDGLPSNQVTVQQESRRCPERVARIAEEIVDGLDGAVRIEAHDSMPTGTVGETYLDDGVTGLADVVADAQRDDDDSDVMVLSRTNRVAAKAVDELRRGGIMCSVLGESNAWPTKVATLTTALSRIRAGDMVVDTHYRFLAKYLPRGDEWLSEVQSKARGLSDYTKVVRPDVFMRVAGYESVTAIIDNLDVASQQREWIRAAVDRAQRTCENVRVGTVHAAKGLEADTVLLLDAYPSGVAEQYGQDADLSAEERRVAYVAVTRAEREFRVIRGVRGDMPYGHREQWPMFRGGLPGVNGGDQV